MKFVVEPSITKDYLLQHYTQESYLTHYLNIPVRKGLFKSPLRHDSKPTCSFYTAKDGTIIFKDFSGDFSGDFVQVVKKLYNCSYSKALNIIATDFGLKNQKSIVNPKLFETIETFKPSNETLINVKIKDFGKEELNWWNQYGITLDILKKYNVFNCDTVFLNNSVYAFSNKNQFIFGYYRESDIERWRIYMPFKKSYRFISNWKQTMIQGSKQLPNYGDCVVITKSLKDVMTLNSLGINSIAPCSETLFVSLEQFNNLKKRFKQIILFYDNDLPGISNMNKIRKKFDVKCTWIPRKYNVKDISDFHKKYGKEKTKNLIKSF